MATEWPEGAVAVEARRRLALEAEGTCPNSGCPFEECVGTPDHPGVCDCFLTAQTIRQYVHGCQGELARLNIKAARQPGV